MNTLIYAHDYMLMIEMAAACQASISAAHFEFHRFHAHVSRDDAGQRDGLHEALAFHAGDSLILWFCPHEAARCRFRLSLPIALRF